MDDTPCICVVVSAIWVTNAATQITYLIIEYYAKAAILLFLNSINVDFFQFSYCYWVKINHIHIQIHGKKNSNSSASWACHRQPWKKFNSRYSIFFKTDAKFNWIDMSESFKKDWRLSIYIYICANISRTTLHTYNVTISHIELSNEK